MKRFQFMGSIMAGIGAIFLFPFRFQGKEKPEEYIRNCFFKFRVDHEGALITTTSDGHIYVRLDGYAIIPKEEYVAMGGKIDGITITGYEE